MESFALILAAMLAQTNAEAAPPPPPPPAIRADADGDGTVSRAEYVARFDRMDTNRDGQLSREERRAAMPRMGGPRGPAGGPRRAPPPPREGGPDMMAPDREITRADFVARAAARFDKMDANRDGKVDRAEMRAARHDRHGRGARPPRDGAVPPPPNPAPVPVPAPVR